MVEVYRSPDSVVIRQDCLSIFSDDYCGTTTNGFTLCCCEGPGCNNINFAKQCLDKEIPLTTKPSRLTFSTTDQNNYTTVMTTIKNVVTTTPSAYPEFSCHFHPSGRLKTKIQKQLNQGCSGNYNYHIGTTLAKDLLNTLLFLKKL